MYVPTHVLFGAGMLDKLSEQPMPGKKATAQKLLRQKRVNFISPACYTKDSRTYKVVCAIIYKIRADHHLQQLGNFR